MKTIQQIPMDVEIIKAKDIIPGDLISFIIEINGYPKHFKAEITTNIKNELITIESQMGEIVNLKPNHELYKAVMGYKEHSNE